MERNTASIGLAPCRRSNHSIHYIRFRSHKSRVTNSLTTMEGQRAEGMKDSESIKRTPTTLFLRTPSLSSAPPVSPPPPSLSSPYSALLTPPTASRILLSPPLRAPPFPKAQAQQLLAEADAVGDINALTAGCPAHALGASALSHSQTRRSHRLTATSVNSLAWSLPDAYVRPCTQPPHTCASLLAPALLMYSPQSYGIPNLTPRRRLRPQEALGCGELRALSRGAPRRWQWCGHSWRR
jgi:hypothetical protein